VVLSWKLQLFCQKVRKGLNTAQPRLHHRKRYIRQIKVVLYSNNIQSCTHLTMLDLLVRPSASDCRGIWSHRGYILFCSSRVLSCEARGFNYGLYGRLRLFSNAVDNLDLISWWTAGETIRLTGANNNDKSVNWKWKCPSLPIRWIYYVMRIQLLVIRRSPQRPVNKSTTLMHWWRNKL
jgi:hypothetical protein